MLQRVQRLLSDLQAAAAGGVRAETATAARVAPRPDVAAAQSIAAQSIVDALPDAAIILDRSARIVVVNEVAHDIFGRVLVGEHVGRTARQPELADAIAVAMSSGRKASFVLTLASPSERHLDGAAAKLRGFGEDPTSAAVIVVLQDISEREALARMRVEFVANASHELRTPLAALTGFIETLRGSAKDDPTARDRFLSIMGEQAQRMTRLIDDLLLLSRVEMRAHVTPQGTVDLTLVAADAIKQIAATAKRDGVTILTRFDVETAALAGDHDELVQAVLNLLSNAVKYGKPRGTVTIHIGRTLERRGGSAWTLSVSDDGPGIAAEHLPRLTERFYRVNTVASREKGGTGLGLAIVKHIAARHRGRVEVASTLGVGTTLSLIFPLPPTR